MRKLILLLVFAPCIAFAQTTPDTTRKLGENPLKLVDSVKISNDDFLKIDPNTIADVTLLYDTTAMKIFGDEAKDGAVLCETKDYVRKRFIALLRRKSIAYDSLYNVSKSDSTFQYIINDKVELTYVEGDFSIITINNNLFISLEILSADELKTKYNITDKTYGILIRSHKPGDLYHKGEKF